MKDSCRKCGGFHFSYLCSKAYSEVSHVATTEPAKTGAKPKEEQKSKPKNNKNECKEVHSKVVVASGSYQGELENASILPTFSCKFENTLNIRCLKDCGSQANFIVKRLVDLYKLKVIDNNVTINLNGINASQCYKTQLVEVHLEFGAIKRKLTAIVLPDIKLTLNLNQMDKVVEFFINQGKPLADKLLYRDPTYIDNFDFILGANSSYCLPEKEVTFGKNNSSVYSETEIGVLLKGEIPQLLEDLPYLCNATELSPKDSHSHTNSPIDRQKTIPVSDESTIPHSKNEFSNLLVPKNNALNTFSINVQTDRPEAIDLAVVKENGDINEKELQKAVSQMLEINYFNNNYDSQNFEEQNTELNNTLVQYALDNTTRDNTGRLTIPLLWNGSMAHLLGKKF